MQRDDNTRKLVLQLTRFPHQRRYYTDTILHKSSSDVVIPTSWVYQIATVIPTTWVYQILSFPHRGYISDLDKRKKASVKRGQQC